MSQYSEMMGSFMRTGNYPLEANYIFPTEAALKEFYSDPINATTLHKGLFRIVENGGDGRQALYWVVKKQTNDELEFVKLIQNIDVDNIDQQLSDLIAKLDEEIQNRQDADTAIWGTYDSTNIPDDLNSIMDLSQAVTQLRENISELRDSDEIIREQLRATVGTEQTDIVEYLKTLPYKSLTETANALNKFLNETDESTSKINTLPELQSFLEGYTDTDKLSKLLEDLWNKIEGEVLPSDEFMTLRGIEQFVRTLDQFVKDRTNNLQTELDQTQIGVGLSGDGSYNADKETNYLQDATSVMNALKILDGLMHEAISGITITPENQDVVNLSVRKELEGYVIAAKLLLSNAYGNELVKKDDGLYISVISEYDNGTLTLKVNDKVVSQHILGFSSLVDSAIYDPAQESIIIIFKLLNGDKQTISIPVGALIREWEPDNTNPDRVVELYRETVVNGADKVSADVRIAEDVDNILEKQGNTLIVRGTSDNIKHDGQGLNAVIEDIKSTSSDNQTAINQEVTRAKEAEAAILAEVTSHVNDTANPHQVTKEQIGLGKVDNTSDLEKPVSLAQQEAIRVASQTVKDAVDQYTVNGKKISENPVISKEDIGLGNVDNTSDIDKPISTAVQEALNEKQEEIDKKAPIDSPILTGIPQVETSPDAEDSSQRIPSTNWVNARITKEVEEVRQDLTEHIQDKENPHNVTAEQVGAYDQEQINDLLENKADLVDGKVPASQLPDSTISWIEVE